VHISRLVLCCLRIPRPRCSTLFPYTTLFRSPSFDNRGRAAVLLLWTGTDIFGPRRGNAGAGQTGLAPCPATCPSGPPAGWTGGRSEEHTSELQSRFDLVCRLLLEKKKNE